MAKSDQENVSFVTLYRNFYYVVMPFGLEIVGEIYQRFIDKIFGSHIKRNIKLYVDDILVKSSQAINLAPDLEETFEMTREVWIEIEW